MAALRARTMLLARDMGREPDLARLDLIAAALPTGNQRFLTETPRLRDMIGAISQQQRVLNTAQRADLRAPLAQALRTEIIDFRSRVSGMQEPIASVFRAAAAQWLTIADRQFQEASASG